MDIKPVLTYSVAGNTDDILEGEKLYNETACLLIAGGQGTRLGTIGPKGTVPFPDGTTLFSRFANKLSSLQKEHKSALKTAIMTAPGNHKETIQYFEKENYFGLEKSSIQFFMQDELPFVNSAGNPLFNDLGEPILAPAGNGGALHSFFSSRIPESWKGSIRFLNVIPIDNAFALPFDPNLIGFHKLHNLDAGIKAILRDDPEEKVGLVLEKDHKIQVLEYSEIDQTLQNLRDEAGELQFHLANTGMYSLSFSFAEKIAALPLSKLPIHLALKKIPKTELMALKQERFLFDIFAFSDKTDILVYPKQSSFFPIKTKKDLLEFYLIKNNIVNINF